MESRQRTISGHRVSGQLRIGDAELGSFTPAEILQHIDAAHDLAGMTRLLFLPTHSRQCNDLVLSHCRKRGIEVFLWYKVLTDNDIHAERSELVIDAWGNAGHGETGVWKPIFEGEELYRFGCPRSRKYNDLLLTRCRNALPDYDGLFADCIGFPIPSLGLESLLTCFCPVCLEAEPGLEQWRRQVRELREGIFSASDADLEHWGSFTGLIDAFGLQEFYAFRRESVSRLAARYGRLARETGKSIGFDCLSPAIAAMSGQNYEDFGASGDWLKTRIYCRTHGPSSIPLEFQCLARGLRIWGKRYSLPAVMAFIERSIGIHMPPNFQTLSHDYLPPEAAAGEIERAGTHAGGTPVLPGIECSIHPDYDTGLDAETVERCFRAAQKNVGIVLAWNILFIPTAFLRLAGKLQPSGPSSAITAGTPA